MKKYKIKIKTDNIIGKVDELLFGSFVEHIGRAVYGGLYDEKSSKTNKEGFRTDVIEAVKELGVSIVRYPGGNFVSDYNFKDGIGKKDLRPARLDKAWMQLEPNIIGTDEFMQWCKEVNAKPMMAVNMGTGTIKEASELLEYCNHPSGTYYSDERIKNGAKEPYDVIYWCVGNEMDGSWQIAAMDAKDYGKKARETAKLMKLTDNKIKTIVCGSSSPLSSTFPSWDEEVLKLTYDLMDYISLHVYYTYGKDRNLKDFLAAPKDLDNYIETVIKLCDSIKVEKNSNKTMMLALDEWNVWHYNETNNTQIDKWSVGPIRVENTYDYIDALVVAGLLTSIVNHSDRVKIACLAQLINVIAPIMIKNDKLIKQSTYYAFYQFSKYAKNTLALKCEDDISSFDSRYGMTKEIFYSVCYDEIKEEYIVFLINIGESAILDFEFDTEVELIESVFLTGNINDFNDENNTPIGLANYENSDVIEELKFVTKRYKKSNKIK